LYTMCSCVMIVEDVPVFKPPKCQMNSGFVILLYVYKMSV